MPFNIWDIYTLAHKEWTMFCFAKAGYTYVCIQRFLYIILQGILSVSYLKTEVKLFLTIFNCINKARIVNEWLFSEHVSHFQMASIATTLWWLFWMIHLWAHGPEFLEARSLDTDLLGQRTGMVGEAVCAVAESIALGPDRLGSNLIYLPAVQSQESYSTSQCFTFLVCKMGTRIVPFPKGGCEYWMSSDV